MNVEVIRRDKDMRKSRKKSLKSLMSGFSRLSRRFNKKDLEVKKGSATEAASLDSSQTSSLLVEKPRVPALNRLMDDHRATRHLSLHEESKQKSVSLPPGIGHKPKPNPKPKYLKKDTKKTDPKLVKEIVRRYSNSENNLVAATSLADAVNHEEMEASQNLTESQSAADNNDEQNQEMASCNASARGSGTFSLHYGTTEPVVTFDQQFPVRTLDRNYKFPSGPQLTPMKDHAPVISSAELSLHNGAVVDDC